LELAAELPSFHRHLRLHETPNLGVHQTGSSSGLYFPGSNQPACSKALAERMVEGGWLVKYGERYQPTEKGWHAGEAG
ncbi:hypothetical protein ABIB83_008984, partial [Bradyrhizobium sp. I1.8.5]